MKQEMTTFQLIVIACFIGILLTVSIFYLTNVFVMGEDALAPYCYDGSARETGGPVSAFNRAVYQSEQSLDFIHRTQYYLFDSVNSNLVIVGGRGLLFGVEDSDRGYHYLSDFSGNEGFTDEELAQILQELQARAESNAARDPRAEYLLVIIPNAQTVYSEEVPDYYGTISENTRLEQLQDYLLENGFQDFINLTEDLRAAKEIEGVLLYHNTENALNSIGLYYAYSAIYEAMSEAVHGVTIPVTREEVSFDLHTTGGRALAQKAGLAHVIRNNTWSLSSDTVLRYRFLGDLGFADTSVLPEYRPAEISGCPELLLQFSREQDRLQSEPYFSNTFGKVTYQVGHEADMSVYIAATPRLVIQFIYENELSDLLVYTAADVVEK